MNGIHIGLSTADRQLLAKIHPEDMARAQAFIAMCGHRAPDLPDVLQAILDDKSKSKGVTFMYERKYEIKAFTLVPLPDDTKIEVVDAAAEQGLLSWIVNLDGSLTVQAKSGDFSFIPTEQP